MSELMMCALSVAGVLLLLFLPIVVSIDCHFDLSARRLFFGARLYGRLLLAGGYVQPRKQEVAIHLSEKKALLLPYGQMIASRPNFKLLHGIRVTSVCGVVETGPVSIAALMFAAVLRSASSAAGAILKRKGCRIRNDVLISETDRFLITLRGNVRSDILHILILISKLALEAFFKWIEKKKSIT